MVNSITDETVVGDPEFANLLDELTERLQSNGEVDMEEYLERFPQYADQLEQLVPAMQTLIGLRNEAGDSASGQPGPRTSLPLGSADGTLGDFRIIREIGRGGMGVVYEAEQLSLRRRMALKVLPFAGILDEQVLKRFKNEALAAATLDHPNIVQVHSVGCDRGVHYYAMQLIEGQSLAETITELRRIRQRRSAEADETADFGPLSAALAFGSLSPQEDDQQAPIAESSATALTASPTADTRRELQAAVSTVPALAGGYFRSVANLGLQAAAALNHAHANGILHRDIKPGNLLIDGKGKLWVTDFGLARIEANAPMTMTGDMLGTLRYMCPESAAGGRERLVVDQRADIYSLGITLYELLTLQPAFEGKDRKELFQEIIFTEPRPPHQITKAIPDNLETIVLKAIRKDPLDRYATAGEMAADLQRFLNDEPIRARRPTLAERMRMWSRRNRTIVAAALVMLVVGAVGSLAMSGLIWQEQQRTADALQASRQNETKAERKAAESKAVIDFLINDLLGSAAPQRAQEDPVTVKEVLLKAEEKIDNAFQDQPIVEAAIRNVMGKTYYALARYADAERHLARARKLRIQWLGAAHTDTLSTTCLTADVIFDRGRMEEARDIYEEVVEVQRSTLGRQHPRTLASMERLAMVQAEKGELEEASALLKQILEIRLRKFGPDHPSLVGTMQNLAMVLWRQDELAEARALLERAVELQNYGPEHPITLILMNCLAMVLQDQGEIDEARMRYEEVLQLRKRTLGPGHHDTLISMLNLGALLLDEGQYAEARPLFEEVSEEFNQLLGAEHPQSLMNTYDLALVLASQGEFSQARSLLEDVLQQRRRILGPTHADTLATMDGLAWLLGQQGKFDEAHGMYEQILKLKSRSLGPEHADSLRTTNDVASSMTRLGQFEEARRLAEETLAKQQNANGIDQVDILNTKGTLAGALQGLGRISQARELREEVVRLGDSAQHAARERAAWMRELAWAITLTATASAEDRQRANELVSAAIELRPEDNESWRVRGAALAVSGQWKESLAAFEKAIELGFGLELLPTSIVQRIDQSENRRDQDFQRLMNLIRQNAPAPASQAPE